MARRKINIARGITVKLQVQIDRARAMVKEHEDNGRFDTYWHSELARLLAAAAESEKQTNKDSEVTNGSSKE